MVALFGLNDLSLFVIIDLNDKFHSGGKYLADRSCDIIAKGQLNSE